MLSAESSVCHLLRKEMEAELLQPNSSPQMNDFQLLAVIPMASLKKEADI